MEITIQIILNITKKTAISFFVCVMFICVMGSFMGNELIPISTLFQEKSIAYDTIFQIFSLSFIVGIINVIFDYPKFMQKTLLLYKTIIRLVIIIGIIIIFIYFYDWFPFTNIDAWIGFVISFGICFGSALSMSLYTTRKKNQEYQELLNNYKKRGQRNGSHSH